MNGGQVIRVAAGGAVGMPELLVARLLVNFLYSSVSKVTNHMDAPRAHDRNLPRFFRA